MSVGSLAPDRGRSDRAEPDGVPPHAQVVPRAAPSAATLLDTLAVVVWSASPDGRLQFINAAAAEVLGHTPAEFFRDARLWDLLVHRRDRDRFTAHRSLRQRRSPRELEFRIVRADGREVWLHERIRTVNDADGCVVRIDGQIADVTSRKAAELRLGRLARWSSLLGRVRAEFWNCERPAVLGERICRRLVERDGFSLAWIGRLDAAAGAVITLAAAVDQGGALPNAVPDPGEMCASDSPLLAGLRHGRAGVAPAAVAIRIGASLGLPPAWRQILSLPLGAHPRQFGCLALVSTTIEPFCADSLRLLQEFADDLAEVLLRHEPREGAEQRLGVDRLTGLPTRALFLEHLARRIDAGVPFALMVFDVDRFKFINESLGHAVGDALLGTLAQRLRALRPEVELARPGGDDFALVLPGRYTERDLVRFFRDRLLPLLARPIHLAGEELRVSLKSGVARFPANGAEAAILLGNAERAHRSAQSGAESLRLFDSILEQSGASDGLRLENRLRRALERGEFCAQYQPKIDLRSGRMVGVEALLRWNDPDEGLIRPERFIQVLEETGVVLEVGRWMLAEVARQFRRWAERTPFPPRIAVNISPQHLCQRDFLKDVEAVLDACPAFAARLELEITESSIMVDMAANIAKLRVLRERGVEVSLDDFGTGYSSLSHLTRLPLSRLKIDRSFIAKMTETAADLAVVSSIISLAHTLDLKVTAEGVETSEQLKFLRLLRCDETQGYWSGPPLDADHVLTTSGTPA